MAAPRSGDRRRPASQARRSPARTSRHGAQGRPRARDLKRSPATAQKHSLTFTSRAAVLGLVLCAAVLSVAYPMKEFLAQRSANASQAAKAQQLTAQIQQLQKQHAAAQNPAIIEQQARQRLHYTLPGERNYIQVTPPAAPKKPVVKAGNAALPTDDGGTWFGQLWESDQTAGS